MRPSLLKVDQFYAEPPEIEHSGPKNDHGQSFDFASSKKKRGKNLRDFTGDKSASSNSKRNRHGRTSSKDAQSIKHFEKAYGVTIINNAALFKNESNSMPKISATSHIKGAAKKPKFNAGGLQLKSVEFLREPTKSNRSMSGRSRRSNSSRGGFKTNPSHKNLQQQPDQLYYAGDN